MDTYETDRDTLEDVLYRRLQMLWDPFTDALKVFQKHTASQPRCAQKVWEALLTAFPLDHKSMQTSLLARELARMMRWDGDTPRAVNLHFNSIVELHHTLNFIGDLSVEDVLQSVLLATLRASPNASLRAAYHAVIDAVDDDKELTFALIQDHCAREIRRTTRDPDRHGPARGDARRFVRPQTGTPTRKAAPRRQDFSTEANISTFLCNILKPTTSSLSEFSRTATFLLTTCRMVMLLMLCSRLLYLSCLKQWPLTPTHLVRTLP